MSVNGDVPTHRAVRRRDTSSIGLEKRCTPLHKLSLRGSPRVDIMRSKCPFRLATSSRRLSDYAPGRREIQRCDPWSHCMTVRRILCERSDFPLRRDPQSLPNSGHESFGEIACSTTSIEEIATGYV